MTLNEYQEKAMTTCMPSSRNFSYMMLNLVGEVGEFASKIAKMLRKQQCYVGHQYEGGIYFAACDGKNDREIELRKEAGDILWQLAGLCAVHGWSLEDVAKENLDKLASRQQRNVIDGNGDNR